MRTSFILCLVLISTSLLDAQSRRMANPQTGRTYSTENLTATPWPLLQLAEQQLTTLNYEAAFLTLESVVAQYPNSAEALILRAKFKTIVGMQAEAEIDFRLAQRINPYATDLYGYPDNRGILNLLARQPEEAFVRLSDYQKLNYYYEFLDKESTNSGYSLEELNLIEQLIGQIEEEGLDQALQTVVELLAIYPPSAVAYDLQGLIFVKQNEPDAAIQAFSKAIEIDPNFALSWYNLGSMNYQLGHLPEAKKYIDKAIELEADLTKAYFARAMIGKAIGNKESALADYDSIIAKKGAIYPEALLNRGLIKKMIGTYASALTDLNKGIQEFPNNPELYKNRGNLYLLLDLVPKAVDDYTKAIQLKGDYADAYYNRGIAHLLMLDRISGCADLDKSSESGNAKAADMKSYFCVN